MYTAPSVIIVGAGSAGIAAASRLLESNFTEITIIEAEKRTGGRIHTFNFGNGVVDMGAEWCHGEKDNIVHSLVEDLNLLDRSNTDYAFYHSSRKEINDSFSKELSEIFVSTYERADEEDIPLGDYFNQKYNSKIAKQYKDNDEMLKIAQSAQELFRHFVLSMEGAFSWFDPTAAGDYKECTGDMDLNWKGRGYRTILDVLIKKIPDKKTQLPLQDKLILNKEVSEIIWNNNTINPGGISVKCSDNSVYNADHLIVTVSLGVLKKGHRKLFKPELPKLKQDAIEEIGMGAIMKVALHFPTKWWPYENFTLISLIWSDTDAKQLSEEFPEGPSKDGKSWLLDVFGFVSEKHNPNVLMGFISGQFVPDIELLSDEILTDGIVFVLNKFLGHKFNVTRPNAIARSKWFTNPHFLGTYSYQTVTTKKGNTSGEVLLAQPLRNNNGKETLLFAGEATHPHYFSTVHGAIETGFREADRIINMYI